MHDALIALIKQTTSDFSDALATLYTPYKILSDNVAIQEQQIDSWIKAGFANISVIATMRCNTFAADLSGLASGLADQLATVVADALGGLVGDAAAYAQTLGQIQSHVAGQLEGIYHQALNGLTPVIVTDPSAGPVQVYRVPAAARQLLIEAAMPLAAVDVSEVLWKSLKLNFDSARILKASLDPTLLARPDLFYAADVTHQVWRWMGRPFPDGSFSQDFGTAADLNADAILPSALTWEAQALAERSLTGRDPVQSTGNRGSRRAASAVGISRPGCGASIASRALDPGGARPALCSPPILVPTCPRGWFHSQEDPPCTSRVREGCRRLGELNRPDFSAPFVGRLTDCEY